MLSEHEKYYKGLGVDFSCTYKSMDRKLEWCEPTTPREVFYEIFSKIECHSDWVFFDCGCGLGHAMYLASTLFSRVYGVEHIPEIANICKNNLNLLISKEKDYKIFNCDMFELDISIFDEVNVFYISSPFNDNTTFEKLIAIINNSILKSDREAWIIYFYPYCEKIMEKYAEVLPLCLTLQTIGKVNYYHHRQRD
jgi:hypothetical protein